MDVKKVFSKKENVKKLFKYVESFDNKLINLNLQDENTFSFYFIPQASAWNETLIKNMVDAVRSGHSLAYGSSIREATVKLNVDTNGASVKYSYPNHFGTKGMDDMAAQFDNFLYKEIDASYKDALVSKFIKSKFEEERTL